MLGTGQGQSPVRKSRQGGHSGENSISGKTGIHFKISAQKGQQGCSQARWGPPSPYDSPHKPCSPHKGPWPGPAGKRHQDTISIMRQGQEGRYLHHSLNIDWGVRSERACSQGPSVLGQPSAPLPSPTTRHPIHISVPRREVEKETRVNASVQHLREATEMGEREPS